MWQLTPYSVTAYGLHKSWTYGLLNCIMPPGWKTMEIYVLSNWFKSKLKHSLDKVWQLTHLKHTVMQWLIIAHQVFSKFSVVSCFDYCQSCKVPSIVFLSPSWNALPLASKRRTRKIIKDSLCCTLQQTGEHGQCAESCPSKLCAYCDNVVL